MITEQDLLLITENTSNTFSAFNTHPDSQSTQLENEENFLQGNAALSLETVLGDYQVNIQLSGEKTALKDEIVTLNNSLASSLNKVVKSDAIQYTDEISALRKSLGDAKKKIKRQDRLILEAKRESFGPNNSELEKIKSQNKKIKALRKKLTHYKEKWLESKARNSKEAVVVEVVETIDVKKLNALIKSGALLSKKEKKPKKRKSK